MNLPDVKVLNVLRRSAGAAWIFYQSNKPSFLTGFAMGGVFGVSASSAKAGAKSSRALAELDDDADTMDKVKAVLPFWVEPLLIILFVEIMIFGANHENMKRIATLASAYSLSVADLNEYKEKAEEIVGKKKAGDIQQAVDQDREMKMHDGTSIIDTGRGTTIFRDALSGQKFYGDRFYLEKVVNDENHFLNENGAGGDNPRLVYVTRNDIYRRWGINEVEEGDDMGWNSYGLLIEMEVEPVFADNGVDIINVIHLKNSSPTFYDD